MKTPKNPLLWEIIEWQRPFDVTQVWEMLSHLASLSPHCPLVWEVRGRKDRVTYLIGARSQHIERINSTLSAHGDIHCRKIAATDRKDMVMTRHLKITHKTLSLNIEATMSEIRAGLAAMAAMKGDDEMVLQVMLGKAHMPTTVPERMLDPTASALDYVLGNVHQASSEHHKSAKQKAEQYRFNATVRIGVSSFKVKPHIDALVSALKILEGKGVRIQQENVSPSKFNDATFPRCLPLQLSVKELACFLLLPIGDQPLPGTPDLHPKPLAPPGWYPPPTQKEKGNDRSFAISMDEANPKKLSISPKDSLLHTVILGPTGSGKSTAMQHLIMSDVNAGHSVLVIDPKADLVNDILARIPEERTDDVVVIDPSDPAPVGFNPLAFKSYENPPLVADAVLSVLKELWADNWGGYAFKTSYQRRC